MKVSLIQKYNVPGPRYTSYPTVPYWDGETSSETRWPESVQKSFAQNKQRGISLYIHLPFCESMCTFCGCHKRITKNHAVEHPYIESLLKEWALYCKLLGEAPIIKEIHLGGGTPTFFSVKNLEDLINGILKTAIKADDHEFSFEGHPNNTTREHLQKLYNLGFRRVSYGVQDYSETVQRAINRIQPFQNVAKVTLWAHEIGYTSVGHDIIFGLPHQTMDDVIDTIEKTKSLRPDRLAFYSYAHVPWIKGNGQRGFTDSDVPKDAFKRNLYEQGKKLLLEAGYHEIGMDHFALKSDRLYTAFKNGTLNRNFMGYTECDSKLTIGLGVSAISDSWYGFAQNSKSLEDYYQMLEWGELPVVKGHILNEEDLSVRLHIRNLMCEFETKWNAATRLPEQSEIEMRLNELEKDKCIVMTPEGIKVTETGKPFIRNICMAFDLRLVRKQPNTSLFSLTV